MKQLATEQYRALRLAIESAIHEPGQLALHKLHCLLLVTRGRSSSEVADWFGHSTRTIERWAAAFAQRGAKSLSRSRPGGRRPRLSLDVSRNLQRDLRQPPAACGCAGEHWSGAVLRHHLLVNYLVPMSLRQCQRILHHDAHGLDRSDSDCVTPPMA